MSTNCKRPLPSAPQGGEEDEGIAITEKKKKKTAEKKSKPLNAKFGGMTEEEVCKKLLPDHMGPGLDIIFVRHITCLQTQQSLLATEMNLL